jgi:hypothetical protein
LRESTVKDIVSLLNMDKLTGYHVKSLDLENRFENGDSDILAKIPTLVGERSEISNLLREDIEQLTKTI